jgi:S1-C subfamily serine protease
MSKKLSLMVVVGITTLALMACSATALIPGVVATTVPTLPLAAQSSSQTISAQQDQFTQIYTQFNPGVVSIRTSTGEGSGWVYSGDGYIVTNNHVVSGETQVEVDFSDGTKVFGKVIGTDSYSDIAVVKVDVTASELHPLPIGDSNNLVVGQTVVAIGNPFGLSGTMTTGIISALGRALPSSTQASTGGYYSTADIIQTDAALNPGNSGGPLINMNGEVIGMNSDIESTNTIANGQASNSGVGFAISINTIKRIVPSLIQSGSYAYPYLGVSTQDNMPLDVINALGLTKDTGAYVVSVIPGGPADQAGIKAGTTPLNISGVTGLNSGGDLIIAIDSQPVITFDDMIRYLILNKNPGDTVTLTILRGSQQMDIPVVLGTRPSN